MNLASIVVTVVLGLAINECCDISPWAAQALMRWAARCRYASNPERAEIRAIELAALIDARPGKIFKLLTACGFATAALCSQLMTLLRPMREVDAGGTATARPELEGGALAVTELMRRAADGNRTAWERLVDLNAKPVWAASRDFRLTEDEFREVFQTTWLQLLERLGRREYPDDVGSWLVATARTECLRSLKARTIVPKP